MAPAEIPTDKNDNLATPRKGKRPQLGDSSRKSSRRNSFRDEKGLQVDTKADIVEDEEIKNTSHRKLTT